MIVIELPDEAATAGLAARIAKLARPGDVIALKGELGAGKTSFARAFIRARGGEEAVPSPTFTLVQVYELVGGTIWHIDGYRLRDPEEAWELDIEDAFNEGISLIEWPEKLGALVPARRLEITLSTGPTLGARRASIDPGSDPGGQWAARLAAFAAGSTSSHPRPHPSLPRKRGRVRKGESGGPGQALESVASVGSRFRGNDGK
jgi:tRNA threonylcarbamoyladenosine biosynthesis protein TsaE